MPTPLEQAVMNSKMQLDKEMPDVSPQVSVSPNSMIDNLLQMAKGVQAGGKVVMSTSPLSGNVSYDPQALDGASPGEIQDLMVHELTHSRQVKSVPLMQRLMHMYFGPTYKYGQDPDELSAFQAEGDYARAHGRSAFPMPNFSGPGWRHTGDIELKPKK